MARNTSAGTSNISQNELFQQLVAINKKLDKALTEIEAKDALNRKLTAQVADLTAQLNAANASVASLSEQITLMAAQRYGKKSEKRAASKEDDLDDSDPSGISGSGDGPVQRPNTHRPLKKRTQRKPKQTLEEAIRRLGIQPEKVVETLDEEDRFCKICGAELTPFAEKHVRYEVICEPPKIRVIDHVVNIYRCEPCHRKSLSSEQSLEELNLTPVAARAPEALLPGSWASASFLSFAIGLKMLYQIPTNRLIAILRELGCFSISSGSLCTWIIKAAQTYFLPLYERLKEILIHSGWVQADETTLLVINESIKRRKLRSFIWQYRTAESCEFPIVLFDYRQGRSGKYAAEFLDGFEGVLLVDGYAGYNQVEKATLANCWVHARRYFIEACLCTRNQRVKGQAETVLSYIDRLFEIEQEIELRELDLDAKMAWRQTHSLPLVEELFSWVRQIDLGQIGSEKMRKACGYLLNHETGLKVFLNDPVVPAHNNAAEESFVSIARGRHNWLFAYSEEGASALSILSSITKTARRCGLNIFKYLEHVMNRFKGFRDMKIPAEEVERVLPWNSEVKKLCAQSI